MIDLKINYWASQLYINYANFRDVFTFRAFKDLKFGSKFHKFKEIDTIVKNGLYRVG